MNTPIKLRWVLAHIPYDLFLRSANIFAQKMREKSNGMVEIEIMGADTFAEKYAPGQVPEDIEFMELVNNGTIEMSQMYNTRLLRYNNDMSVL